MGGGGPDHLCLVPLLLTLITLHAAWPPSAYRFWPAASGSGSALMPSGWVLSGALPQISARYVPLLCLLLFPGLWHNYRPPAMKFGAWTAGLQPCNLSSSWAGKLWCLSAGTSAAWHGAGTRREHQCQEGVFSSEQRSHKSCPQRCVRRQPPAAARATHSARDPHRAAHPAATY